MCLNLSNRDSALPAEGLIRGTMTGALLCSLVVAWDEFAEEEEEGEEEGTLEASLSPVFMVRTEGLTLVSRLLGFGDEFSATHRTEFKPQAV